MPAKNPRLILTLPPELDRVIRRYAAARDQPRATALTELLLEMVDPLDRLAETLEEAKKAPEMAFQLLLGNLSEAYAHAAEAQHDLFSDLKTKAKDKPKKKS